MSENALIACQRHLREVRAGDLPLVQRAVYVALAGRANDEWIAFPALPTIAQDAGTAVSTVRRALDWLSAHGWIEVVTPATPRDAARYLLRLKGERSASPEVAERYVSRGSAPHSEGERSAPRGVALRSERGSAPLTEDPIEDHKKIPFKISDASEGERRDPPAGDLPLFAGVPIDPPRDPIAEVWSTYLAGRDQLHLPGAAPVLDEKRRKLISARLQQLPLDDVRDAAAGIWLDPWHVQKRKLEPEYVFRDVAHVEKFRDVARQARRAEEGELADPSESWPEAQPGAVPPHDFPPPPRPPIEREPETEESRRQFEELRKLPVEELKRRTANTMGLWGPEDAFGRGNL